ncbi:MAG: hypothetical protein GY757_07455 [bacterium]|nr:hypothetical protein [bacterium]
MRNKIIVAAIISTLILFTVFINTACSKKVDKTKDFTVVIDEAPMDVTFLTPRALLVENEHTEKKVLSQTEQQDRYNKMRRNRKKQNSGSDEELEEIEDDGPIVTNTYNYSLTFGMSSKESSFSASELRFVFSPDKIPVGELNNSKYDGEDYGVSLRLITGTMTYIAGESYGDIDFRFDQLDPQDGGRIKGKILEAVLYPQGTTTPIPDQQIKLYNIPFDATLAYELRTSDGKNKFRIRSSGSSNYSPEKKKVSRQKRTMFRKKITPKIKRRRK